MQCNRELEVNKHAISWMPDVVAETLLNHGRVVGNFMAWHSVNNKYHWLIAEALLRRTTRVAAERGYLQVVEQFPNWYCLSEASEASIAQAVASCGLANVRAKHLKRAAQIIVSDFDGATPCQKTSLLLLPGVGHYTAEAVLLYGCGQRWFPLDGNTRRVLGRMMGAAQVTNAEQNSPYHDQWLTAVAANVVERYGASDLALIHRGMLSIAWTYCRPSPLTATCPVRNQCKYATLKQSHDIQPSS